MYIGLAFPLVPSRLSTFHKRYMYKRSGGGQGQSKRSSNVLATGSWSQTCPLPSRAQPWIPRAPLPSDHHCTCESGNLFSPFDHTLISVFHAPLQMHYVERSCRILVINAPFLFSLVWSVVSPWINERTREKISIVGTNYKDELLKVGPRFECSIPRPCTHQHESLCTCLPSRRASASHPFVFVCAVHRRVEPAQGVRGQGRGVHHAVRGGGTATRLR